MGIIDVPTFLAGALTPPDTLAVEGAVDMLRHMGALDGDTLTALGRHLSIIPADLRCGKLLVYGATFGCLEACLTIASILTMRSPFVSPQDKREQSKTARQSFGQGQGDLLADLRAYEAWSVMRSQDAPYREQRAWCEQNFLSQNTLNDITSTRAQYISSLKEIAFLPPSYHSADPPSSSGQQTPSSPPSFNKHNASAPLLRALITASFTPQLLRIAFPTTKFAASVSGAVALDPEARTIKYFAPDASRAFIHPSSTLFDAHAFPNSAAFLSYFAKVATSKVFVRDLTPVGVYAVMLFAGPLEVDEQGRGVVVDGWVRIRGWARIGVLVGRLRGMLDRVLERAVDEPGGGGGGGRGEEVVDVVRRLVELDGLDR
ncbi:hypothetical protein LTS18_004127 [Coniosporium uncinatum]|uniref:Uncharacterized protein n=1 Tax=Coniosporium uncinatum TaxID=93489 RepID=A0ACC3DT24_9PEZI|nr:hypothetical protein LTS18_004127 [Coniosporium uncinatum]